MIKLFFLSSVIFYAPLFSKDQWNGVDYANDSSLQLTHAQYLLQKQNLKGDKGRK
ncbi:MAG: hypothetical protein S4CHLAM7_01910 [Chlamydiae bacterium]|nr:hypothetical protein [Chlamydiota bacterium]